VDVRAANDISASAKSPIKSPFFDSSEGWSSGYALATGHGPGVVVGPGSDNPNVFAQTFKTTPGAQYKAIVRGTSVEPNIARGAFQISWHDANGNLIKVTIEPFDLGPIESTYQTTIVAPSHAELGILYVVPGSPHDVVRYTEMSLTQLEPLSDFLSYRFLGIPGETILTVILPIVIFLVIVKRWVLQFFLTGFGESDYRNFSAPKWNGWIFPALALVLSGTLFVFLEGMYEHDYDAQWHQASVESVMRWKTFSLDLGGDPLHNFGVHHAINPQLSPTFWIGWAFGADHRIQIEGAVQAILFFVLLFQLCRISGARRNDAAAISLIAVAYLCVPMLTGNATTLDATLGLLWQEAAIAALAAFFCFACIGCHRVSPRARRWATPGLALVIVWIALSFSELFAFFAMATVGLCIGALLGSESKQEVIFKFGASALVLVILLGIGLHEFIFNLYQYTPQLQFQATYEQDFPHTTFLIQYFAKFAPEAASLLYIFFAMAVIGGVFALRFGNAFARRIVLAAISLEVSIYLMSTLNAALKLAPVRFIYVEQTGISVVALLAGVGVWGILRFGVWAVIVVPARWAPVRQRPRPAVFDSLPIIVLLCAVGLLFHTLSGREEFVSWWPPRTSSTPARIQAEALAVNPGQEFKGRGAVLLGMASSSRIDWPTDVYSVLYHKFRGAFGNDLKTHAEAADIPMINEYGHWMSPAMLSLMAAAFYDPSDPVHRADQVPRRFRANLARLLGVSLVVSDQALPGQTLLYQATAMGHPIYIHSIADANLGHYTPIHTIAVKDAHELLDHLQAPDFDGRNLAVVEQNIYGDFVPAQTVSILLDRGARIRVEAWSEARSLLVLPFEFSHCLRIDGVGVERMIPVNLAQIGVVIRGRATFDIAYRYGLVAGTTCRSLDLQRVRALDLEDAATGRLFFDPRLIPRRYPARDLGKRRQAEATDNVLETTADPRESH